MQVSEQIIAVLDDLAQRFGVVIDWGQQNVMPYIQELCGKCIKFEIITSIAWICLGVIIVVVGSLFVRPALKSKDGTDKEAFWILTVAGWIIGTAIIVPQVMDIIGCCVFPEYQVFEFLKDVTSSIG